MRNNSRPGVARKLSVRLRRDSSGTHGPKRSASTHASTGRQPGDRQFGSQISAESQLRFGPQADALASLLRQAISDRDQGLAVQRSTAQGLIGLADRAQPQIAAIEGAGAARLAQPYTQLQTDFAQLGSNADPIKAAALADLGQRQQQQTAAATAMQAELGQRRLDARAGQLAGVQAVQSQYAQDKGKITDQLLSLTGQQGAFGASRLAELMGEQDKQDFQAQQNQAGRDVTIRGQNLSHQDRVASQRSTRRKSRLQSADKHEAALTKVQEALGVLREADPDKTDRHGTAPFLVSGAPASTGKTVYEKVTDPITKKVTQRPKLDPNTGTVVTVGGAPATPAYGPWATIAADLYYDGHLSRANQAQLQKRGYSIRKLQLPSYGDWKRRQPARSRPSTSNYLGGAGAGSGVRR